MGKKLAVLDSVCEQVSSEIGTIRSHGIAYDYWVQKAIDDCIGEKREDVQAILNKYANYGEYCEGAN